MRSQPLRYLFGNRALLCGSKNKPMQTEPFGKLAGGSPEFRPPFRGTVLSSRTQPCQSRLGFPMDGFRQPLRQIRPDPFSNSQIVLVLMAQWTWPFWFGNQLVDQAGSPRAGITDAPRDTRKPGLDRGSGRIGKQDRHIETISNLRTDTQKRIWRINGQDLVHFRKQSPEIS